jgi:hypothetical protein
LGIQFVQLAVGDVMEVQEKTHFSICGFTIKEGHVVVVIVF